MDLVDRMLLKLESQSVGEQFPFNADESTFKEGWLLSEVFMSVFGGFPLEILDLAVDLLRIDPFAEPLAEVFGVRGVEPVDEELEFPIMGWNAWF